MAFPRKVCEINNLPLEIYLRLGQLAFEFKRFILNPHDFLKPDVVQEKSAN